MRASEGAPEHTSRAGSGSWQQAEAEWAQHGCRTIEINLRQMLGEPEPPPPVQPVDGILY